MVHLTLAADLRRIEHQLAFLVRTSGASRSEVEGLRALLSDLHALRGQAQLYERLLEESPPTETETELQLELDTKSRRGGG